MFDVRSLFKRNPVTNNTPNKEKVCTALCTPIRPDGKVSIQWSNCVQNILEENYAGWSTLPLIDPVGNKIAEVRNNIVSAVLENPVKFSHIMWLDDDVLVFPGCYVELLHQNKDICTGVYFTKLPDNLSAPLLYSTSDGGPDNFIPDISYPIYSAGMGLTLVRTEVYRRMVKELNLPLDEWNHPQWYRTSNVSRDVRQLDNGIVDLGMTEDTFFYENAHKLGYEVHAITTKHAFGFHFDPENKVGYPTKQWNQWINGEKIVWDTPEGPVEWD